MILIDDRQNKIKFDTNLEKNICHVVEYTLKEECVSIDYEISIILIDNTEIQEINKQFRGIDKETDVLSFPMLEYEEDKVYKDLYKNSTFDEVDLNENRLVLGDIAISLEKANTQATEYGHSLLREVAYLTVHSVLHLLGYDHMCDKDKEKMRKREEEILIHFDIKRE